MKAQQIRPEESVYAPLLLLLRKYNTVITIRELKLSEYTIAWLFYSNVSIDTLLHCV